MNTSGNGRGVNTGRTPPAWDDTVPARCWCATTELDVPLAEIRQARTRTCGRTGCQPPF